MFSLIWAVLQLALGVVFVVLQIILTKNYRIKDAWQPGEIFRQRTQLDFELSEIENEFADQDENEVTDDDKARLKGSDAGDKGGEKQKIQNLSQIDESNEFIHENDKNVSYDFFSSQGTEYKIYKDTAPVGSEQQKYRLIATKLRYVSFAVEGIVAASVIALVTMNTIIRMLFENEIFGSQSTIQSECGTMIIIVGYIEMTN